MSEPTIICLQCEHVFIPNEDRRIVTCPACDKKTINNVFIKKYEEEEKKRIKEEQEASFIDIERLKEELETAVKIEKKFKKKEDKESINKITTLLEKMLSNNNNHSLYKNIEKIFIKEDFNINKRYTEDYDDIGKSGDISLLDI